MKYKRLKRGLAITASILLVALLAVGFYLPQYALRPAELTTRSRAISKSYQSLYLAYPELRTWIDSLNSIQALRHLYRTNQRGERMHALYIHAARPTRRTAVIVHGYTDNAVRMLMIGYLYNHELGYNALLPDLHGHGLSEGNEVQMGWLDRLDVLQWTATADSLFSKDGQGTEMVVHGISMGAATTMMLSGDIQRPPYERPFIKCMVEDCGYTSVWDEFRSELKARFHLPAFPLLHLADIACQWQYGWEFRQASALEQVKKCTLPMLFIHGDADTFVPTWMVYPLYEAKPQPKELWIVPGARHAVAYKENKAEYTARVKRFTERYIH